MEIYGAPWNRKSDSIWDDEHPTFSHVKSEFWFFDQLISEFRFFNSSLIDWYLVFSIIFFIYYFQLNITIFNVVIYNFFFNFFLFCFFYQKFRFFVLFNVMVFIFIIFEWKIFIYLLFNKTKERQVKNEYLASIYFVYVYPEQNISFEKWYTISRLNKSKAIICSALRQFH